MEDAGELLWDDMPEERDTKRDTPKRWKGGEGRDGV